MSYILKLNKSVLQNNYNILRSYLTERGFSITVVSKILQSHPVLIKLLEELKVGRIADSYSQNLEKIDFAERWNLCIGAPQDAKSVVQKCNLSVHSNFVTLKEFRETCQQHKLSHEILLMIDMGDWREGFPLDLLMDNVGELSKLEPLKLRGLAINLTCFAGVKLADKHLENLTKIAYEIRKYATFNMLSIGNSSALPYLESWAKIHRKLWKGVDWNIRVGEALFCGTLPGTSQSILNLENAFRLSIPVVESHTKDHTLHLEDLIPNSFGKIFKSQSRGSFQRILLGAGRVDFDPQFIDFPTNLDLIGASSDLTVLLNHGHPLTVGEYIECIPSYHAIMNLALSPRLNLQVL